MIYMKRKIKTTERGWAGHFICSHDCRFRRNTLVECGEKRVVVSTVGDMHYNASCAKIMGKSVNDPIEIGHKRHYETMAFKATLQGQYWDADFGAEEYGVAEFGFMVTDKNHDIADDLANAMHENNVGYIAQQLREGKI